MLYLTCTTITSVDLAHYRVSHAKDWVSVDCCTSCFIHLKVFVCSAKGNGNFYKTVCGSSAKLGSRRNEIDRTSCFIRGDYRR